MRDRLSLHDKLVGILQNNNAYYQPPSGFRLQYPCVLYNQEVGDVKKANNKLYTYTKKYSVTFIYKDCNDDVIEDMLNIFNHCRLDSMYITDNLYHYVFTIYY